jgi:biopolymer transport protein ExbB/TolQ
VLLVGILLLIAAIAAVTVYYYFSRRYVNNADTIDAAKEIQKNDLNAPFLVDSSIPFDPTKDC